MNNLITTVMEYGKELPLYQVVAAVAVFILVIVLLIVIIKRRRLIRRAVARMESGEKDEGITARMLNRPRLVEALIKRKGDEVIRYFGVADYLLRRLDQRKRPEDVRRLLKQAPEVGMYPVFRLALQKKSVAVIFRNWLEENKDILLVRSMAQSAGGDDFEGDSAWGLLAGCVDELRELSGDPEWPVRYFTLRVLLSDDNPKSRRLVKESFTDPHPLLRRTVAEKSGNEDPDELFTALMSMVLDDPVPEVRQSARQRIDSTFSDRWRLNPEGMDDLQAIHVLELLKVDSKEDENIAINALKGSSLEARLVAARFLEKSGSLERLFTEANRGDREDWERRENLLGNAVSVNVTGFLEKLKTVSSVDVLLLGAEILKSGGDSALISYLADRAFSHSDPNRDADEEELYRSAVSLACTRGDEKAHSLLCDELRKRRNDPDILGFVLPLLPSEKTEVFREVLLDFLQDEKFKADEAFLQIMTEIPPSLFLGPVLDILEADRSKHSHAVRLRALKCLGVWHLDYTLQTILENLPILPMEQAHDFALSLRKMNTDALEKRAGFILASPDAGIRAALIAVLPAAGISSFTREIREGLNDADPNVRIACLRALFESGEIKASGPALALLRDPVEQVRIEAARIAGKKSTGKFLETLESILNDKDESSSVRIASMEGLAVSENTGSVAAMVRFLNTGDLLQGEMVAAMARKTDRKSLVALVEHFKDSEAILRDRIAEVFIAMGEKGEDSLVSLLEEDIASLKPFLSEILTRTGFVEILIRKLSHRKPQVRREAAELLAQIATDSAYRGIVQAARDPDREVRVKVTRALESLASPASESILKSLQDDPDRRVRRYTHWAMERLKARKLP